MPEETSSTRRTASGAYGERGVRRAGRAAYSGGHKTGEPSTG
ncbi:MAG TPA: hypothetical protein VFI21_01510 [Nocardioides sp.]|nr:hypothetical protein [Nocardioides sp.]